MSVWSDFKTRFDRWEQTTAHYLENVMRSNAVLNPAGHLMSTGLKLKAARDRAISMWWSSMGLPTKQDQERTLHALNQLHSRIYDLEDRIKDLNRQA